MIDIQVATLTAASAGASSTDYGTRLGRGIAITVDITAITGTTPTLTVILEGKDTMSGKYYTVLSSTALNAVATTVLTVYPGMVAAANSVANNVLPAVFRVRYAIAGTTPAVTATIGASVLL